MSEDDSRIAVTDSDAPSDTTTTSASRARTAGRARSSGAADSKTTRGSPVWPLIALVIAMIASGAAVYLYFEQQKIRQELAAIPTDVARGEQAVEQLKAAGSTARQMADATMAEVIELSARIEQMAESLKDSDSDDVLALVDEALAAQLSEVRDLVGPSREDWLLAETEYLLRLASQRLLMDRDVPSAIALIRSADAILADAHGLTVFELRASLAEDLAALGAVADLDTEGIFLKLSALIGRADDLRQRQLMFSSDAEAIAETAVDGDATLIMQLTTWLNALGNRMAALVDYRVSDERIRPVLPAREEYYLRQNLIMKYQLAQLALLSGKQEIFANSVDDAKTWIHEYFDDQDTETRAVIHTLDELGRIDITREIPDISVSLRLVRALQRVGDGGSPGVTAADP